MGTPEHLTHLLSNLHEGQEAIVRTGHGTIGLIPNWERSMALYCHPAYLAFKQSESERHSVMSDSLQPHGLYSPLNSPGQNTRVGSLSLLQVIFSTQESNQDLLHCRRILYQLSYKGNFTSCKMPSWMTHKLEEKLPRKISTALDNAGDNHSNGRG